MIRIGTQPVGVFEVLRDESGATAVEYALIGVLVAIVTIAGLALIGGNLSSFFSGLSGDI